MRMQSRKGREDPEINLIPLIDVSLLLVIFFMLSSTFMQEGRLKIELPQASLAPTGKQKVDPIVVIGHAERQLPRQRSRADQLIARHAARRHPRSRGRRSRQARHRACRRAVHASVGGQRHGRARQARLRAHQHRHRRRVQPREMNSTPPVVRLHAGLSPAPGVRASASRHVHDRRGRHGAVRRHRHGDSPGSCRSSSRARSSSAIRKSSG